MDTGRNENTGCLRIKKREIKWITTWRKPLVPKVTKIPKYIKNLQTKCISTPHTKNI